MKKFFLNYKFHIYAFLISIIFSVLSGYFLGSESKIFFTCLLLILFNFNLFILSYLWKKVFWLIKIILVGGTIFMWFFLTLFYIEIILFYEKGPTFNYYSEGFYRSEYYEVTGLELSEQSKILTKNDSLRSLAGDYEHTLHCIIKLNPNDKKKLLKALKQQVLDRSDTLRIDEFNNSFLVPENNPLKGLNYQDFRTTYHIESKKDFQDSYTISFHKDGVRILFKLNHI